MKKYARTALLAVMTSVTMLVSGCAAGKETVEKTTKETEHQREKVTYTRQAEYLDRGLVAVRTEEGVFLSWRFLGTDTENVKFHVLRNGSPITDEPLTDSTNYLDLEGTEQNTYSIQILNGSEVTESEPVTVWAANYLDVPIQAPEAGMTLDGESYQYSANDASVSDLDGDGSYEIILKWEPSNAKDNSKDGYTGNVYLDAYELDGTRLWRIDLGKNIRAGAHYTQFMVYDLDGDGIAEMVCKTADGTMDGVGNCIGDATADYRNSAGRILEGPEYLTLFDGKTGAALDTIEYEY